MANKESYARETIELAMKNHEGITNSHIDVFPGNSGKYFVCLRRGYSEDNPVCAYAFTELLEQNLSRDDALALGERHARQEGLVLLLGEEGRNTTKKFVRVVHYHPEDWEPEYK